MPEGLTLTGLARLDEALGGLLRGRAHLLTGGPGSGKTALSLRFLWTGLERGETALLVTLGDGRDLKALATHLGMDLDRHLRAGRLLMLRYRDEFTGRLAYSGQPDLVIRHLDQLIDSLEPKRIVIDPATPFLADGTATGEGMAALTRWLERTKSTSIVTWCDDVSGGYDRRIEPLVQSAAAVLRLDCTSRERLVIDVVTARYETRDTTVVLSMSEVALHPRLVTSAESTTGPKVCDVLYAYTTTTPSQELLGLVRGSRLTGNVTLRRAASVAHPPSVRDVGGVVIEADRRTFPLTLQLVPAMAQREPAGAIVVVARAPLRSIDRARLLESGADDVLASEMSTAELLARLENALERGHHKRGTARSRAATAAPLQRGITKGALRALHAGELAQALRSETTDEPPGGALLRLRPSHDDDESRDQLLSVVLRSARVESGDLVALTGDTIVVHLRGTRREDAEAFLDRVRARWSVVGNGTIRGEPISRVDDVSVVPASVIPLVSAIQ